MNQSDTQNFQEQLVKQNSDTFDFGARKERSDSMESFHERQQAQKQGRFKIVR
jgi:hypothetical protein